MHGSHMALSVLKLVTCVASLHRRSLYYSVILLRCPELYCSAAIGALSHYSTQLNLTVYTLLLATATTTTTAAAATAGTRALPLH
jgi:hypothetical protein